MCLRGRWFAGLKPYLVLAPLSDFVVCTKLTRPAVCAIARRWRRGCGFLWSDGKSSTNHLIGHKKSVDR